MSSVTAQETPTVNSRANTARQVYQTLLVGLAVNEALTSQFPSVVDLGFTAALELQLDSIETGESPWVPVVRSWYEPFSKVLDAAQESMPRVKVKAQSAGADCPKCGAELVMRSGRFGDFVGCSRAALEALVANLTESFTVTYIANYTAG